MVYLAVVCLKLFLESNIIVPIKWLDMVQSRFGFLSQLSYEHVSLFISCKINSNSHSGMSGPSESLDSFLSVSAPSHALKTHVGLFLHSWACHLCLYVFAYRRLHLECPLPFCLNVRLSICSSGSYSDITFHSFVLILIDLTPYDIKIVFCTGRECPSLLKFAYTVSLGSIS